RDLQALGANFINLPAIGNVWGPTIKYLQLTIAGTSASEVATQLDRIVAHHDEALTFLLHGHALMDASTAKTPAEHAAVLRRAEASFRKAVSAPSLIPHLSADSLYWATYAEVLLAKNSKLPPDPEMRELADRGLRRLLAERRLNPVRWAMMAELACD